MTSEQNSGIMDNMLKWLQDGTDMAFEALWIDDIRPIPDDLDCKKWTGARTAWEAIVKLDLIEFNEISLDHDLGSFLGPYKEVTGYDIVKWLVQRKQDGGHVPKIYHIHSANPVGRKNMQAMIDRYLIN